MLAALLEMQLRQVAAEKQIGEISRKAAAADPGADQWPETARRLALLTREGRRRGEPLSRRRELGLIVLRTRGAAQYLRQSGWRVGGFVRVTRAGLGGHRAGQPRGHQRGAHTQGAQDCAPL